LAFGVDTAWNDIGRRAPFDRSLSYCLFGGLDVARMTFAPLCRGLPGFARCLGEYYRLSMRLPAIKSEQGRFVEVRLTFRLDADSQDPRKVRMTETRISNDGSIWRLQAIGKSTDVISWWSARLATKSLVAACSKRGVFADYGAVRC